MEPSKQTVTEYLREWLPTIEATVKATTWHSDAATIEDHVVPTIGSILLRNLAAPQLNALYAELLKQGRKDGKGGLSPRTVRYVHTILHRALEDAVRWGRLFRNPVSLADPPRQEKTDMKTWTAEQTRHFLRSVKGDRLYAAYLLAFTTGMRRGELLGLRWSDIDFEASRLSIQQTLVAVGYRLHFSDPKTKKSRRSLALDGATLTVLRIHRAQQAQEKLLLGSEYEATNLVFSSDHGKPAHPMSLSDMFRRRATKADLPVIRFHDIRHTYASLALAAGVHPKVVSERLGHSSITITLDTYSHAIPALQEEAANKVAALRGSVRSPPGRILSLPNRAHQSLDWPKRRLRCNARQQVS